MESYTSMLNQRDIAVEREILAASGIFDPHAYVAVAGQEARRDPIGHYLETGWRLGLEPNRSFPGSLLRPYFVTLGADEPPAITWLMLRAAGWTMPERWEDVEAAAAGLRATGLFDEASYNAKLGVRAIGLDPAIHYVLVGERMGISPSVEFDPAYYSALNTDVVCLGMNCLQHYADCGRIEGRKGCPPNVLSPGRRAVDPGKENIILVVHDTTRTGAPILGWNIARHLARRYNIFTVRIGDGEITPEFEEISAQVYGPFLGPRRNEIDIEYSLRKLLDARKYRYAIVNSAESRLMVEPCIRRFIPTILLVHEFASYVSPLSSFCSALEWTTELVFSAPMVAKAAEQIHPHLWSRREIHIIPQGVTVLPTSEPQRPQNDASSTLDRLKARRDTDGTFIVLGVGAVHLRKGVDLFLATAAAVMRRQPKRAIHFLWVGDGYRPQEDMHYSVYLQEQLTRSGLADHVTFLGVVSDVQPAYRIADAFFLSSRLDPLPNVAIDAAVLGIPIVCFREASGIADLLLGDPDAALGVVDYLDTEGAGRVILELATDRELLKRIAESTRELARINFDMKNYVAKLDALGRAAAVKMEQRLADAQTLLSDPAFDQDMFLGPTQVVETRESTIARYFVLGSERGWRRPFPGFNPRIYAAAHASRLAGAIDPLADYVRRGKPVGPWQATVLRPHDPVHQTSPRGTLRVALHAHFFYPELCGDFLAHLGANQTQCDLLVSTDDATKAERLRRSLSGHTRGKVEIRVVPNRGRDIGPLLTEFADHLNDYDLVGHVHAKRSLWSVSGTVSVTLGDTWREFLWQNLIGGLYPMMDRIVAAFEQEGNLGLVFPSDPHLIGWDANKGIADEIAARMGWHGALPDHFDFPLGTMFWMRLDAMRPLLNLRLASNDYPEEPVPDDGTLLHALERLIPFACQLAGFTHAVTHVFGVSWSSAAL